MFKLTSYSSLLLVSLLFVNMIPSISYAGSWEQSPVTGRDNCDYFFNGQIENGDLTDFLSKLTADEILGAAICLNSEGGSLGEVLRFLNQLDKKSFTFSTRIRSGDRCISACAILFMFGREWGASSIFPKRVLEPSGVLGFHSPFLSSKIDSDGTVTKAFQIALNVAKLLIDHSYVSSTVDGPMLPVELVAIILGTSSDSIYYVETITELALLDIQMSQSFEEGVLLSSSPEEIVKSINSICSSSYVLSYRQHFVEKGYNFADLVKEISRREDHEYEMELLLYENLSETKYDLERIVGVIKRNDMSIPKWLSAGAGLYCKVELRIRRVGNKIKVIRYYTEFGLSNGVDFVEIPEPTMHLDTISAGLIPVDTLYELR